MQKIFIAVFVTLLLGLYTNHKEKGEEEVRQVVSSMHLSDDGDFTFEVGESETLAGKRAQEFIQWITDDVTRSQNIIEEYEAIMYSENSFVDYESLEKSVQAHIDVVEYLKNEQGKYVENMKGEYKRIYGKEYPNRAELDEANEREAEMFEKRTEMYGVSKTLYDFYLANFELIEQNESGGIFIDDAVYDEYELLYTQYSNTYDDFEAYRSGVMKDIQNEQKQLTETP